MANNDGTRVSVGHAGDTLYVLFRCPIPEKFRFNKVVYASIPLKMTAKEKDGDIFQDDYVGVCLTPPGSRDVYFLGVNGAGSPATAATATCRGMASGRSSSRATTTSGPWSLRFRWLSLGAPPLADAGLGRQFRAWRPAA